MKYVRMPIEIESPEEMGYSTIRYNLTESSFADARVNDLGLGIDFEKLLLCYGDHRGKLELRQLIAQEAGVQADDVLLTPGAAPALFIIATTLLEKGDRLLVEHPNYATNIETPRAIGAEIDFIRLRFATGFRPILSDILAAIRPETKYVSVTLPHNPTGTTLELGAFRELIAAVTAKAPYLLVDETYRGMGFDKELPVAASLSDKCISVSSLSKTFGLPGIRMGWIICRDKKLMNTFLAAKEQMLICGSVVDEEIAYGLWRQRPQQLDRVRKAILSARGILKDWYAKQSDFEWVEPEAGVVCFPRLKESSGADVEKFHRILNEKYGTFVGPGHWFEMDRRHFRIGYAWTSEADLRIGLENLNRAARDAR